MDWKKSLHDAVFTDDEKDKKKAPAPVPQAQNPPTAQKQTRVVAPVAATVPTFAGSAPVASYGFGNAAPTFAPAPVGDNADIYEAIKSKTDFDATTAGQILNKYLAPMASVNLDQGTKLKIAAQQAAAQEGLTPDKLLATFDGLKVALSNELESFQDAASKQTDGEIVARQNRINEINTQIAQLQQEQQQLATDLVTAQTKVATTTQQFQLAVNRRGAELEQQKAVIAAAIR